MVELEEIPFQYNSERGRGGSQNFVINYKSGTIIYPTNRLKEKR